MTQLGFDESKVNWYTVEGIDDVWLVVLDVDEKRRSIDVLFKFSANAKILLHKHKVPYRTFIIQGELRLYDKEGNLTEIRPAGSYVSKPASESPHTEGGGDIDVIALFSNREVEDIVYEVVDENMNIIATLGFDDFKALYDAYGVTGGILTAAA